MPNQREIAARLGIAQSTVSWALRGDLRVSAELRQRVLEASGELGYHPNAYVNILMSHIRSGKKVSDKGVIAMLVDSPAKQEWFANPSYRAFHDGVVRRGLELGYNVEGFFLADHALTLPKLERVLYTRNIRGIILPPPYHGNRSLNLHWDRYAAVGVGFGWEAQDLDRVVFDTHQNFVTAFQELRQLGYQRIGAVLGKGFVDGNRCGTKWFTGYLECQSMISRKYQIPPFQGSSLEAFCAWITKWKPDALVTLGGKECESLNGMGLRVPEDIGVACLAQPVRPEYARIDEKADVVGATALEVVISKIARNEYGQPCHPKVTMVEGRWVTGATVRKIET